MMVLRVFIMFLWATEKNWQRIGLGDRVIGHPSLPQILLIWAPRVPHPGKPLMPGPTGMVCHHPWIEPVAITRRAQQCLRAKWLWECGWMTTGCMFGWWWQRPWCPASPKFIVLPQKHTLLFLWMETNYSYLNFRKSLQKEKQGLVRTK